MDPLMDGQNYIHMHYADMIGNGYHREAPCPFQTQGIMLNPDGGLFFCENSEVVGNVLDEDPEELYFRADEPEAPRLGSRRAVPDAASALPDERGGRQAGGAVREIPGARVARKAQEPSLRARRSGSLTAAFAVCLVALNIACSGDPSADSSFPPPSSNVATTGPLRVAGERFVLPDGAPFAWRGISAFRLLEMEAAGRAREVDAYLTWTASGHLNVVRVLAMAKHLFELPPETGLAHLDTLLARAAAHGLFVEVVALADTASYRSTPRHISSELARICRKHPNALLEIANEPYHATQAPRIHEREYLRQLLRLVPPGLPAAVGAADFPTLYDDGTYATAHFPGPAGRRMGARARSETRQRVAARVSKAGD